MDIDKAPLPLEKAQDMWLTPIYSIYIKKNRLKDKELF